MTTAPFSTTQDRNPDEGRAGSISVRLIDGSISRQSASTDKPCVITEAGAKGCALYGPYLECSPGFYHVTFEVGLAGPVDVLGDPVCVILDVVANDGQSTLAERRLLLSDLSDGLSSFRLSFQVHEPRVLEYRVQSSGQAGLLTSGLVTLSRQGDQPPRSAAKNSQERLWQNEREFLDGYLRNVSGIIHVGANTGQERRYYWLLGLDVIWVEPIREVYERLVDNIAGFSRQRPVNALLADKDGLEIELQIANNGGASSSILNFEDHAKLWPGIEYVERRRLVSTTLKTMMQHQNITGANYQALTLDVEGAELLVLQGAVDVLDQFQYVKCEVADFPAREGTPSEAQLDSFLRTAGFRQLMRRAFAMGPDDRGTYWDIVWKKVGPGQPFQEPGYEMPLVSHPADVEGLEKID